jgi:hypothetical protein
VRDPDGNVVGFVSAAALIGGAPHLLRNIPRHFDSI